MAYIVLGTQLVLNKGRFDCASNSPVQKTGDSLYFEDQQTFSKPGKEPLFAVNWILWSTKVLDSKKSCPVLLFLPLPSSSLLSSFLLFFLPLPYLLPVLIVLHGQNNYDSFKEANFFFCHSTMWMSSLLTPFPKAGFAGGLCWKQSPLRIKEGHSHNQKPRG